ncbi:MAG: DUF1440 domain-containing protein [Candidatus Eremiobacteraeota bacterium]|nr:DUF1440 domain-containing protein [Candidatus Eremiobacteraeota bacterium]
MNRNQRFLTASVAGGVGASFAMDLVQDGFTALFERDRAEGELDEEVEGIASVVRVLSGIAPKLFPAGRAHAEARAIHYVFGVGFAAAYVAGAERAPWLATSGGVAFGAALFLLSDRILIPVLKLGRSWSRYSRSERANALLSHVVYGIVLEYARARYAKPRDPA